MSNTRDQIREAFFNQKPRSELIHIVGIDVELRQPTVGDVLSGEQSTDRAVNLAKMLINYTYVPGTNEKVFEPEDIEALRTVPMGDAWMALTEAINNLSSTAKLAETAAKN